MEGKVEVSVQDFERLRKLEEVYKKDPEKLLLNFKADAKEWLTYGYIYENNFYFDYDDIYYTGKDEIILCLNQRIHELNNKLGENFESIKSIYNEEKEKLNSTIKNLNETIEDLKNTIYTQQQEINYLKSKKFKFFR